MSVISTARSDAVSPPPVGILADYIAEQDLAAQLGVTVRALQLWRTQRRGPAWTKLGKKIVYRRQTVAEWMRAQEQKLPRNRSASMP